MSARVRLTTILHLGGINEGEEGQVMVQTPKTKPWSTPSRTLALDLLHPTNPSKHNTQPH